MPPVEPQASRWNLPDPRQLDHGDLVGVGADLQSGTLLAADRTGMFPMPVDGKLAWWSPDPRALIPLDGLRVTRSLHNSCRRYDLRINTAFDEVVSACAEPGRPGGWISKDISAAFVQLHRLGWAHSVEAWDEAGRLAGGLYGVAIGGLFAGESMFYRGRDASKVALVALVDVLREGGGALLDVQWMTEHLARLGAVEVERGRYLDLLADAIDRPLPRAFDG